MTVFDSQDLDDIQGFGLEGFRKPVQRLLGIRLGADRKRSRQLLRLLSEKTDSVTVTQRKHGDYKQALAAAPPGHDDKGERSASAPMPNVELQATLITAKGLQTLGRDLAQDMGALPGIEAFTEGMAARGASLGDVPPADPHDQPVPTDLDLLAVIAGDDENAVEAIADTIRTETGRHGATVAWTEKGGKLPGHLQGREHFGFRDGISQPAVDGYGPQPPDGAPPPVQPGEFVLGYPRQDGQTTPTTPITKNGSFVVLRRLRQDVAKFRSYTEPGAAGLSGAELQAKLVGRWPSGAPLELHPDSDPGGHERENAFAYAVNDAQGLSCPRWAHIRKANPRDEAADGMPPTTVQGRRMIRRGASFGDPLPDAAPDDGKPRGLHFLAVVADPVEQFENVQVPWLNAANFPNGQVDPSNPNVYQQPPAELADGPDPIAGQFGPTAEVNLRTASSPTGAAVPVQQCVSFAGGEYLFLPSLSALRALSAS